MRAIHLLYISIFLGIIPRTDYAQIRPIDSQSIKGTPLVLPRPDFHFPGEVGRTYLESAPPQFPQPIKAPKGAPNIVLILIDDAGFGQFSTFGGGVPSPTMDRLAAEGLRYNRFHTTSLCSPTRAALITGRNHHSVSFGSISEAATGYDGYVCILPKNCGTIAEVLRQNGYMTAWIGKNPARPVPLTIGPTEWDLITSMASMQGT
jgi:arylsulfatase